MCQISDRVSKDQVHTVEVLVPPSMRASPESRHAAARRGGAAVLECRASGNPVPTVTWHKLVSALVHVRDHICKENLGSLTKPRMTSDCRVIAVLGNIAVSIQFLARFERDTLSFLLIYIFSICFQNDSSLRLGEGPQLQLSRLERQHSGKYACTVDNGVGPPIVSEFTLQVLCKSRQILASYAGDYGL